LLRNVTLGLDLDWFFFSNGLGKGKWIWDLKYGVLGVSGSKWVSKVQPRSCGSRLRVEW